MRKWSETELIAKVFWTSRTLANICIEQTAEQTGHSKKEVIDIILSKYPDEVAFFGRATTLITAKKYSTSPKVKQSPVKRASPNKGSFTNKSYDIAIDDQSSIIVPDDKQEYQNRDFTKILHRRFPKVLPHSRILATSSLDFGYNVTAQEMNKYIFDTLKEGENLFWTNQTLSYTRSNIISSHIIKCIIAPLIRTNLFELPRTVGINIVDATANIGGDVIGFAITTSIDVNRIYAYEINKVSYDMLNNNRRLYGVEHIVTTYNKRFDYNPKILKNALVIIDPPYESAYNKEFNNFNLSIDDTPIYNVAQKCLDNGAKCVMLTMPSFYVYNKKFAIDYNQHVTVYQMGTKNNKIFLVTSLMDGHRLGLRNFKEYNVTEESKDKIFNCKIEDIK